jgi:hypothetical protein
MEAMRFELLVIGLDSGRLFAIRQEVCRHLSFAFDFDSPTALKLVRLMPQDLINFLRYLFGIYTNKMKKNLIQL